MCTNVEKEEKNGEKEKERNKDIYNSQQIG